MECRDTDVSIKIAKDKKVLIPQRYQTGRRSIITLLPVRSYLGIDTFCLPWWRRARDPAPTVSSSKTLFFSKLCVHEQCSQCSCSCVETLVTLRAKFYVVSSIFGVLKITIWCQHKSARSTPLKISLPENKLKSASFVTPLRFLSAYLWGSRDVAAFFFPLRGCGAYWGQIQFTRWA